MTSPGLRALTFKGLAKTEENIAMTSEISQREHITCHFSFVVVVFLKPNQVNKNKAYHNESRSIFQSTYSHCNSLLNYHHCYSRIRIDL